LLLLGPQRFEGLHRGAPLLVRRQKIVHEGLGLTASALAGPGGGRVIPEQT